MNVGRSKTLYIDGWLGFINVAYYQYFTSKACHFKPAKYVLGLTLLLTHPIQWHKIYCKNCTADETESCSNEVLDGIKRQCQDMHWVKNVTTPYAQLSSILTNNSISQSNRYQIIRFWSHAWAWILNKNTATDISRLSMCSQRKFYSLLFDTEC